MRALIVGAGIAGPTLAYWLAHYGVDCTMVEKAPRLRTGGYIIDFWGRGFDVAERMGLTPELLRKGYLVRELRVVDESGKRIAGFPVDPIYRVTGDRYVSLPRGELAASIYGKLGNRVETIFGDTVARIEPSETFAQVTFESGLRRDFDIVIGADGLHSRVRRLVFGEEKRFEKFLGYKVAAFEVEGYRPRDELAYVMYTEIGQQAARFAMKGDRTLFLLTFADDRPEDDAASSVEAQKAMLRRRFGNSGWECARILEALDASADLYFDRISQIRMDAEDGLWTRGRVALIGDAAFCPSLFAGQGSALAMAAAYILAGELHKASGNYRQAFRRYEEIFAPFVRAKQERALQFRTLFGPKSRRALFLRNQIMNLLRFRWFAEIAFGRDLKDDLELPEY